jgi:two-component system, cell cycle sensor histidine kinase and response regulator CckA
VGARKEILIQPGGSVWVYSEMGQGASFKIYLPQAQPERESAVAKIEVDTPAASGESILVVEDEESLRKLISNLLSRLGYRVAAAANGGEALLPVEERGLEPDMVITDVVMPNMSGKALIDRLRRNHPHLKVLYMSGYTDNAIVHHGFSTRVRPFCKCLSA